MRNLYIITYTLLLDNIFNAYNWAESQEEAIKNLIEAEENPYFKMIKIEEIKNAIHKDDLSDTLERYITKPVLNKTLMQYSHSN